MTVVVGGREVVGELVVIVVEPRGRKVNWRRGRTPPTRTLFSADSRLRTNQNSGSQMYNKPPNRIWNRFILKLDKPTMVVLVSHCFNIGGQVCEFNKGTDST